MKLIFFFPVFFIFYTTAAQPGLPVIRANTRNVSINDGGFFDKDAWTLSPSAHPDIYTADRTRKPKWVVFYTDVDSIKVKLQPGAVFDFIILLNGKDSCFTRIASAIPPIQKNIFSRPDTIPFTLTAFDAISVQSVLNGTDTVHLHFDVGSFDFRLTRDAVLLKTSLLPNKADVLAGTGNADYNHLNKLDRIQMGRTVFTNPVFQTTGVTAHEMDGRFGWNLFEGKIVEINYDRSILVIHSALPATVKSYTKSDLLFIRSFVCVNATVAAGNKKYTGNFLLDTGSDQAMILDSNWATRQQFPNTLPLISSKTLRDPRGVQYETRTVRVPQFGIHQYSLNDIPTLMLGSRNPVNFEVNYLGNGLLKRFNILLDFKTDHLYLKPNQFTRLPFKANS